MDNQQFPSTSSQPQIVSLPGAGQLLKEALKIYKSRIWVFLGIITIYLIVTLLTSFLLSSTKGVPSLIGLIINILWFVAVIFGFWAHTSLLYAIKEREQIIGIRNSFAKGWYKILSYLWVYILVKIITLGGYLLLVIPGIIFVIWFSLTKYVLVSEDLRGLKALFRSKQLVKGYWWKVFWRFLVLIFILAVVNIVFLFLFALVFEIFNIPIIILNLNLLFLILLTINFLLLPFDFIFGFLIYENLRQLKREALFEPPKRKTKIGFIIIGIIGALLVPSMLFTSIALVSLRSIRDRPKDAVVMAYMAQIRATAELIYLEGEDYSYSKVSCSQSLIAPICDQISKQLVGKPTIHSSQKEYCSYLKLLSGEYYYCIDSTGAGKKTNIYPGGEGYCDGITFVCP